MASQPIIGRIQWTNKFSGESGFVKSTSKTNKCFYNTFDYEEAKKYRRQSAIDSDLAFLAEIGETQNNIFSVI